VPGHSAGSPVDDETAHAALAAAWDAGVRYFDTAPWYGLGMSEHRVGRFLRGQPRGSYVLSTKVGRVLSRPAKPKGFRPTPRWANALPFEWRFDYRRDAVLRSYEDSLQRLGVQNTDLLLIHDLESRARRQRRARSALRRARPRWRLRGARGAARERRDRCDRPRAQPGGGRPPVSRTLPRRPRAARWLLHAARVERARRGASALRRARDRRGHRRRLQLRHPRDRARSRRDVRLRRRPGRRRSAARTG
jgi:hypothetical protein